MVNDRSVPMVPPTFIFDENQETIAARANRDKKAVALLLFLAIGAGAVAAYAVLTSTLVPMLSHSSAGLVRVGAYGVVLLATYFVHRRFAFHSEAAHAEALPRYATVQVLFLCLAALFSFVAHGVVGLPHLTAAVLVIAVTAGVNFTMLDRWVFAPR